MSWLTSSATWSIAAARVILRVIPASTGVHDGLPGPFTVAGFRRRNLSGLLSNLAYAGMVDSQDGG